MTSICYADDLADIFLHEIHNLVMAVTAALTADALLTVQLYFD